jgi:hypothetical protein
MVENACATTKPGPWNVRMFDGMPGFDQKRHDADSPVMDSILVHWKASQLPARLPAFGNLSKGVHM